jgi:hypothetical protein
VRDGEHEAAHSVRSAAVPDIGPVESLRVHPRHHELDDFGVRPGSAKEVDSKEVSSGIGTSTAGGKQAVAPLLVQPLFRVPSGPYRRSGRNRKQGRGGETRKCARVRDHRRHAPARRFDRHAVLESHAYDGSYGVERSDS